MENSDYRILLVDDEEDILDFVGYNLIKEGYKVFTANNGKEALEKVEGINPHLIILDVMMPELDGIETCEAIRNIDGMESVIIAFLTARNEDYSQIAGFDAGGDDYINKPIKPKVLVSRVKALLKRVGGKAKVEAEPVHGILVDKERYIIIQDGNELSLPKKEFELLALLHSKPDKVFTREEIYTKVWGDEIIVGDRTIDVHIRKLREKLGDEYIKTVKGVGYKFIA
ncbi:MAG: response regulator transcription factor [Bacteroidales bacterium]|jgi:two-component system alkaline phosphatase synthesis response regulator PhoP|nr:response regulator transcription factor [Bacteroidales bacterium]